MKTTNSPYNYLHFIRFRNLSKWYVSYYINPHSIVSQFPLVKLKDIIYPVKDKIKRKDFNGNMRVIKKISFADGKIHFREKNETRMDLYKLYKNDLLVSKINFHQGAVALNNFEDLVCTTHYQPYSINHSLILPTYLVMVLRSKIFLNYIDFLRAEGIKNEATFEFIGELKIPLPNLEVQNNIITSYYDKIKISDQEKTQSEKLESEIEDLLCQSLGISVKRSSPNKGINVFTFQNISKWSVDYILKQGELSSLKKSKYPIVAMKSIIEYLQYGISEKSNNKSKGTIVLRMNNIQNRRINIDDLKHFDFRTSRINKDKVLLNKGDLLFNRTNSKELVGKTAVFDLDGEYSFASYLIRIRFIKEVNPYYVNYVLNSQIGRMQIDLFSRQILGQANINSQEIKEILVPFPPLEIQNNIVKELDSIVKLQEGLKLDSTKNYLTALNLFEQEVFESKG